MQSSKSEAKILFSYLFNGCIPINWIELYDKGIIDLGLVLNEKELKVLNWTLRHPKLIRIVDIGLTVYMKDSNLRKRFLLASAILECNQISFVKFYNTKTDGFAFFKLIGLGFVTSFYLLSSVLLFKFKAWS